jgi:ribosome recycling factor
MIADIKKSAEQKMQKSVEALKHDLGKVRTGRAHTGLPRSHPGRLLRHADADRPVREPDARRREDDLRSAVGEEDGSRDRKGDPRFGPRAEPRDLRRRHPIPMPALTEERRKELIKVVRHEAENARVAVRNIRRDANDHLKRLLKDHAVAEDEERHAQTDVQKLTDRYIAEIDKVLAAKETDLLAI